MGTFTGFPAGKSTSVPLPTPFFSDLLPLIDDLGELKLTLYAILHLNQQQGNLRYLTRTSLAADKTLLQALTNPLFQGEAALDDALERVVLRGTLLKTVPKKANTGEPVYFLNSARGRAALKAAEAGAWSPDDHLPPHGGLQTEQPNIFRLYEENIGPLSPLIADLLRDAEQTYPAGWVEKAIKIAVENNVRRWRYVEGILKSWQENGPDGTNRRDSEKDRRKYFEDEFSDFIER